ncbi:MAG: transcriptional initiation protein Tat [Haloferacaceae archaeon]
MKRRAVIASVALGLSSGCLGSLPRATGPRKPPEAPTGQSRAPGSSLSIETWDYGEADDGSLRVFGTVRNSGGAEATATVAATAKAGEEEATQTVDVTVPAGGTTEFAIVFDLTYEAFSKNGSIDLDLA